MRTIYGGPTPGRPTIEQAGSLAEGVHQFSNIVSYVFVPGKYGFDKYVVESDFNQKHKLVGYNPLEYLITPLDFTPVGAVTKFGKGYKAFRSGSKLVSMGISGFGKKLKAEGYVTMLGAVASKASGSYLDFGSSSSKNNKQSGGGSSLPSKPKPPGKNISYKPKQGARCAPGYRKINGMCVKQ